MDESNELLVEDTTVKPTGPIRKNTFLADIWDKELPVETDEEERMSRELALRLRKLNGKFGIEGARLPNLLGRISAEKPDSSESRVFSHGGPLPVESTVRRVFNLRHLMDIKLADNPGIDNQAHAELQDIQKKIDAGVLTKDTAQPYILHLAKKYNL